MVCSICGQNGHNRRTCPQRNTNNSVHRVNRPIPPQSRRIITRKFWKIIIQTIIYFKRFVKVSLLLARNKENPKYAYFHWLKIKGIL